MRAAGSFQPSPTDLRSLLVLLVFFAPLLAPGFFVSNAAQRRQHIPNVHRHDDAAAAASSAIVLPQSHLLKTKTAFSTLKMKMMVAPQCPRGRFSSLVYSLASGTPHRRGEINSNLAGDSRSSGANRHGLNSRSSSCRRSGTDSSPSRSDPSERDERSEWEERSTKGNSGGMGNGRGGETGEQGGMGGPPSEARTDKGGEMPDFGGGLKTEFSRKIDCSELGRRAKFYTIEATRKECASLAKRFGVERIEGLKADLRVLRGSGRESRRIKVKGRVTSDICQLCASTLEPFDLPVHKEFDTVVQEVSLNSVESTLWSLEDDTETEDEIMEGDPLDLGEIAAQAVALCIDPFAKRPGTTAEAHLGVGERALIEMLQNTAGSAGLERSGEEEEEVIDVAAMNAFFGTDE